MNSLEALKCLRSLNKTGDKEIYYKVIERDLEVLEFIKTHYEMNGFNELIPSYLDYDDDEKFNKLGEWLENE